MRKIVSLIITVALVATLLCTAAFAAGAANIYGDTVHAKPGDTVTIAVHIENNPGFNAAKAKVSADAPLAISAINAGLMNSRVNLESGIVNHSATGDPVTADGDLFTVTVKIADNATPGEYPVVISMETFRNRIEGEDVNLEKTVSNGWIIVDCDHRFNEDDYVYNNDAKCGVDGTKTATCEICGKATDTRTATGTALTHSFTNYVYNNDAECEKDGTETATCDNGCGETDVRTATGTALTHSFTKYVYNNDAECEKDGTETATCDNGCGETDVRTATGTALVHKWTNDDKAPTCTEDGVKDGKHCELCGEIVSGTVLPATGHDYEGVVTKEPTCTEKGVKTYTCKNDAKHTYTEDIDPLGHKWDKGVVTKEPTCGEEGEMLFTCQNDKTHTKTEPIKKLEHDADELEYIDNKDGTHDVYCPGCDSLVIDNEKHMDLDKDGKCDGCGAKMPKQPTTKPTEDDKKDDQPKNGDITPYPVYFLMAAMAIVAVAYGLKRKFDI